MVMYNAMEIVLLQVIMSVPTMSHAMPGNRGV